MTHAFDLDRIGGVRALDALVDEVTAAGEDALRFYRGGAADRARIKEDRSPVTEADEAVEARLRAFLAKRFPDAGFLGEESGADDRERALRFVVDPIDGTRAFVRGIPTWSVLVGLEADGEPVLGVALMPAAGDLFVGVKGDGARMNGRPLHVSATRELEGAVIAHGGLFQFERAGMLDVLPRLARASITQRGHNDFDGYRQLLLGRVDAMVDPDIKAWDICPAAVLVREAGGRFTDVDGNETIHGGSGLATNGPLHHAMLEVVRGT